MGEFTHPQEMAGRKHGLPESEARDPRVTLMTAIPLSLDRALRERAAREGKPLARVVAEALAAFLAEERQLLGGR